jgi:hypothetical protein
MSYGVQPTGFVRKNLAQIKDEIEQKNVETFGSGVIQTAQSPLGQLNGVFAELSTLLWELSEDVYQSFDVDQAEGNRLDVLAKLRRLARPEGMTDAIFRSAINNQSQANIRLTQLVSLVRAVPGVTYAHIEQNVSETVDANGLPPHSIALAVVGGDDIDVAKALYSFAIPGIGLYGNSPVSILDDDGRCRTIYITRPQIVPLYVDVVFRESADPCGCVPTSYAELVATLIETLSGDCGLVNGEQVTPQRVAKAVSYLPGIEIVRTRLGRPGDALVERSIDFAFAELPVITASTINVVFEAG